MSVSFVEELFFGSRFKWTPTGHPCFFLSSLFFFLGGGGVNLTAAFGAPLTSEN